MCVVACYQSMMYVSGVSHIFIRHSFIIFSLVVGRVVSSEWHSTCVCVNDRCTSIKQPPRPQNLQEQATGLSLSLWKECSVCLDTLWYHVIPPLCFILAAELACRHITSWGQPSSSALVFSIDVNFFMGSINLFSTVIRLFMSGLPYSLICRFLLFLLLQ